MQNPIGSRRGRIVALVVALAAALVVAAASAAPIITNGDFQTGNFTGWTQFTTANGTTGTPAVVSFDTTGSGASLAAQFVVGQVAFVNAVFAGGGIFQSVTTPQGVFKVSADTAAVQTFASPNDECGRFELLVDGTVVASHTFGPCASNVVVRFALGANSVPLSAGAHELRVRISRPYLNTPADLVPSQYVDNVSLVASCAGLSATITGAGNINGTPGDDVIVGSPGNDVIMAGGGNDTICGGQGNDVIFGDAGNDKIYGDDGLSPTDPAAVGGADSIWGGDGNDTVDGEAGNDSIWLGNNDDTATGGVGDDSVFGEAGVDNLTGGAGRDSLDGGAGADVLTGSEGNDSLAGGAGNDTLNGDLGPTPPGTLDPAPSNDACNGGADTDTAIFCEAKSNIP